jgi:hypothetical protein
MPDFNEQMVFGTKSVASLMKEIYDNTNKKQKMLYSTIDDIKAYIKTIGDAVQIGPLLGQYSDILVKSDEHLIKLVAIIAKASDRAKETGDDSLTDEEKNYLTAQAEALKKEGTFKVV